MGKVTNIVNAWNGNVNVTNEVMIFRSNQCNGCPFNSMNAELGPARKAQLALYNGANFCLKCNCPISKKITQATEKCPATPSLWGPVPIPLTKILNVTPISEGVKIYQDGNYTTIDVGKVKEQHQFSFLLSSNNLTQNSLGRLSVSICTCMKISKTWRNGIKIDARILKTVSRDINGNFSKDGVFKLKKSTQQFRVKGTIIK